MLYAALGEPFPEDQRRALSDHLERSQAADGYVGDHVAAAFHMAHFYRLIGRPTPKADRMVARVLRDQKPTGGWDIKEPDWDVHAGFDAVFILRQLGGDDAGGPPGDRQGRRLGPRLPERRRRVRPLPRPPFRHGRRLLPARHADPGRAGGRRPDPERGRPARARMGARDAARAGRVKDGPADGLEVRPPSVPKRCP